MDRIEIYAILTLLWVVWTACLLALVNSKLAKIITLLER